MAVEIPVVIDIESAFKEAAKRVGVAIKPLQDYMDKNALNLQLHIDEKSKMALGKILGDANISAKHLKTALADIDAQIAKRAASGGFDLSSGLKYTERLMLQAAGALEYRLNGVNDASAVMSRIFSANIDKAKAKVNELTLKIDDLTRKQNKYALEMQKGSRGGRLNYTNTSKKIEEANAELKVAKLNLGMLTSELDKITMSGNRAAAAVSAIKTPAMEMAESWRRGASYVERYNASLNTSNNRLGMLLKNTIQLVALHAATRFARNVREVTAEFEMQRVALGGIIQDTEMAEDLFKRIKAAAIKSPFEIKDLVTYTKQLSAYRVETDKLFDVTMRLADVSAGLGVDMGRLILAYGQVRAASVLRGQELRQFTEAGIPLVELLAEKFEKLGREGTTTADVFKLISERAVPFKMIEEIFNDMTDAGGIFYKMQEKQSETLKGKWMKLRDALSIMYDEIGNTGTVHKAMEGVIDYSMSMMQNWRSVSKTLGSAVVAMVAYRVAIANAKVAANALTAAEVAETSALAINTVGRSKAIAAIFGENAATKVQIVLGNAYVAVKTKEMMATNLFTRSLYRMTAALLANPYAIAAAGIALLVGGIIRATTKAREAKISVEDLNKTIGEFDNARNAAIEAETLAASYDELKNKTELNAEEQRKLQDITKQLSKTFPDAIDGVNEYGNAVEINTQKIREMARAEQEAMYQKLLDDQGLAEEQLDRLAAKRSELSKKLESGTYTTLSSSGQIITLGYTEKQMRNMRTELASTISEYNKLAEALQNVSVKTSEFYEGIMMVGPAKPEFLGDAWRTSFQRYKVAVDGAAKSTQVFSDDQIRNANTLYDILEDTAKEYKKYKEMYEQYVQSYEAATTDAAREQLHGMMMSSKAWSDMYYRILEDYGATSLLKTKKNTSRYMQDPFIQQMQERMKFMQDFKKGYEDLRKYLGSTGALEEEAALMFGRGSSLGLGGEEQRRAATDLSKWYEEMINEAFKAAKRHGASGTIESFMSQQITGDSDKAKALRDFQKLMQSLWDAKTDLDVSEKKRQFEDTLKRLSNEIKRSETAKNFFQNILDLTGDRDIAATMSLSLYGENGESLRDKMEEQLRSAFILDEQKLNADNLDVSDVKSKIQEAIINENTQELRKYLDYIVDENRSAAEDVLSAWEKSDEEILKDFAKTLDKYASAETKRKMISLKTTNEIQRVMDATSQMLNRKDVTEAERERIRTMRDEVIKALEGEEELELKKLSDDYVAFFAEINILTAEQAALVRSDLRKAFFEAFNKGAIDADILRRNLRAIDEQFKKLSGNASLLGAYLSDGVDGAINKLQEYSNNMDVIAAKMQKGDSLSKAEENYVSQMLSLFGSSFGGEQLKGISSYESLIDSFSKNGKSIKGAGDAFGKMGQGVSAAASKAAGAIAIVDAIVNAVNQSIIAVQELIDELNRARSEENKIGGWYSYISDFNKYAFKGWNDLKSGNGIGVLVDIINSIVSIFNNIKLQKVKKLDDEIEAQSDIIGDLDYQYQRLENSIKKAFGSDYIANYNKQLEVLYAKQAAYEEQARLEREKGKAADSEKIKEYEENARGAGDAIIDMEGRVAEFFSGTDITSAAKDFATSWIEAYKEFGSTTDAMKERFQNMIQEMIINSLAADIMQKQLKPVFDLIDTLSEDGALTTSDIAQIAAFANQVIPQANDALLNTMSLLSTAGYNIRQQPGQFTGIKRNIANATEESINGLTQATNVSNFYMAGIYNNVASILAVMTGGTTEQPNSGTQALFNNELALQYMSALPSIDQNIAELLRSVKSVISDKNSSTNLNVIAVRA